MTELQHIREVKTLLPRRIVDGDTWWCYVDLDYRQLGYFEYRLQGWDTPELFRPEDDWEKAEAKRALAEVHAWWDEQIRAGNRRILIESQPDPEKYGRWLGLIWAETASGEKLYLGIHLWRLRLAVSSDGSTSTRWRTVHGTNADG